MSESILDYLIGGLRKAAIYNRHDLAAPSVVLWTDGRGCGQSYSSAARCHARAADSGPRDHRRAYRTVHLAALPVRSWRLEKRPPFVYLPGIARHAFRGAAGFPEAARHLFALQFQGQFWSQLNGKDWTPSAFLSSEEGGLGLDLARDRATLDAVGAQLAHVLRATPESLRGRRLEATDFHGLAAGDPVGLLLEWMASEDGKHDDWPAERWAGFKALCKPTFRPRPGKGRHHHRRR